MAPVRTARTPLPTCVVFAAGEYYHEPIDVPPGTFVVAADGGYDHARELDVQVDAVVGDFDSVHSARSAIGAETVALPPQKGRRTCRAVTRNHDRFPGGFPTFLISQAC